MELIDPRFLSSGPKRCLSGTSGPPWQPWHKADNSGAQPPTEAIDATKYLPARNDTITCPLLSINVEDFSESVPFQCRGKQCSWVP